MDKCNHRNEVTNGTSIVFDTDRWYGTYPKKIRGICIKCHKTFSLTEEEYRDFLRDGVIKSEIIE